MNIYDEKLNIKLMYLIVEILLLLPMTTMAENEEITVQDLTPFVQGGRSWSVAVNEVGQVVGYVKFNNFWETKGFIWDEINGYQELSSPEGEQFIPSDINNQGHVVGSINSGGNEKPFVYDNGIMTILPITEGINAKAVAINDLGQIVGVDRSQRAWVWEYTSDGQWSAVQLPGLTEYHTEVKDINDLGQLVGSSGLGPFPWERHATLWQKDNSGAWKITDLGALGVDNSVAYAINNHTQIVGWSGTSNGHHAFVWENNMMTDLGSLSVESPYSQAKDINDYGLIVGHSNDPCNTNNHTAVIWKKQYDETWQLIDIDSENSIPGWGVSRAFHVNNAGLVAGETYISNYGAFVWSDTQGLRLLPLLQNANEAAVNRKIKALNEKGDLIGISRVSINNMLNYHASLWKIPTDKLPASELIVDIQNKVTELVDLTILDQGQATALNNSLGMTEQLLEEQRFKPAIGLIRAFNNKVLALVKARQLTEEEGNILVDAAQVVINEIESNVNGS